MSGIAERLEGKRICIVAGSGGVGKTTASAALALGLAAAGKRVAVVTIDPARRLADSLGLEELGNEPRLVDASVLAGHGIEMRGELWAMMLDPKATFDEVVRTHSARVYRLAYRLTGNPHDAADLTQDVFVRVFRSLDTYTPGDMRAPGAPLGLFALESAMDELAIALKMDPVELRRINDTMKEPIKGYPYTSRALMQCFDQASAAFGWAITTVMARHISRSIPAVRSTSCNSERWSSCASSWRSCRSPRCARRCCVRRTATHRARRSCW